MCRCISGSGGEELTQQRVGEEAVEECDADALAKAQVEGVTQYVTGHQDAPNDEQEEQDGCVGRYPPVFAQRQQARERRGDELEQGTGPQEGRGALLESRKAPPVKCSMP
jgi:hypothetical protein